MIGGWKKGLSLLALSLLFLAGMASVGVLGFKYFLDELYPAPPPAEAPALDNPVDAKAERVVLVVLDGVREDTMTDREIMPLLAEIADQGRRGVSITQPVTMTLLSVLNMGTGRTPGIAWSVHNFQAETFPDESVFYWAKARGLDVAFTGDAAWSQLFGAYASHNVTFPEGGIYDDSKEGQLNSKDTKSLDAAHLALADPEAYDFVVYHLVSTDHIGHKTGGLPRDGEGAITDYGKMAHTADVAVGDLYAQHAQAGDVWVFTADHGMTDDGNHGGGDEVTRRAPFVVVGAGVVQGPPIDISLNAWAPTFSLLLGLPIPRTAEVAAAFELFDFTEAEREQALAAHAERRREFVEGIATELDLPPATEDEVARLTVMAGPPDSAIVASNSFVDEVRMHRRWLHITGLLVGAALHILAFFLLVGLSEPPSQAKSRGAVAILGVSSLLWLTLMSLPLAFDHWLFQFVAYFGETAKGWWYMGRAVLALAVFTGAVYGAARLLGRRTDEVSAALKRALVWGGFAIGVIATSHITLKWPYGPLAESYQTLFIWALLLMAVVLWRTKGERPWWAMSAAAVGAIVLLRTTLDGANLQLLDETSTSLKLAFAASLTAAVALSWRSWNEGAKGQRIALGAGLALMTLATLSYRMSASTTAAKIALAALGLALLLVVLVPLSPKARRDQLLIFAIALANLMSSDWIVLMTIAFVGLIYALSEIRLPSRWWTPALLATGIGLIDIAFFYISGYRFAFPAMDVRVAFMLDQDGVNMVAGFFLFVLQHSVIWIALWAAVVSNHALRDDAKGLRTLFVAVVALFFIRAWGPFFALQYHLLNHWYISHAVPMFIMSLVECMMAIFWFALISSAFKPVEQGQSQAQGLTAKAKA